jgi:hypothetical protein
VRNSARTETPIPASKFKVVSTRSPVGWRIPFYPTFWHFFSKKEVKMKHLSSLPLQMAVLATAIGFMSNTVSAALVNGTAKFDIGGITTEHVELTFKYDDKLITSGSFKGYLIDWTTLKGTQDGNEVKGLNVGLVTTNGTANDNLINHDSFTKGGLAYYETMSGGETYQVYTEAGQLKGCWSLEHCGVSVTGFVTSVPEPEEYAMMLLGFGMVGLQIKRKQLGRRS